jgi:uncharacterized protein Veg
LCGRIYASFFIVCFKQPAGIGQKLNWNVTQALEKIYHWHFIIHRELVRSPF